MSESSEPKEGTRPRALDLFCGAGGATKGLQRAGFHVTGVDIRPQPRYCGDAFIQGDALKPPVRLSDFGLVWASPPCQAFSSSKSKNVYPNLIPETRELLRGARASVIENVMQAPLRRTLVLNGAMFDGLKVVRWRGFECSFRVAQPHALPPKGAVSHHGWSCVVGTGRPSGLPKKANAWHSLKAKSAAMGIDWMRHEELSESIPPAYSEHIGRYAMMALENA